MSIERPPGEVLPDDIEAVVFDLDGTLYTLRGLAFHIAVGLLSDVRKIRNMFRVRREMRGRDFGDREAFKTFFSQTLGNYCSISAAQALDWYENRFMARFIKVLSKRAVLRPELPTLLESLHKRRIRLAVVSDFGRVGDRLSALGIPLSFFDEVAGAEDFGVMKPSAEPFLGLADKWGIRGSQMVLVGDRSDHDLQSARFAGAHFIGIKNKKEVGPQFFPWPSAFEQLSSLKRQSI